MHVTDANALTKGARFRLTLRVISRTPVRWEHGVDLYALVHAPTGRRFRWRYTGAYIMYEGVSYNVTGTARSIDEEATVRVIRGSFKAVPQDEP